MSCARSRPAGRWSTCSPTARSAGWRRSAPKCAPCWRKAAAPGCWSVCGRKPPNCPGVFCSSLAGAGGLSPDRSRSGSGCPDTLIFRYRPRRSPIDRRMRHRPRILMTFPALLVGLVDFCRRNALFVILAGVLLVIFSGWYAAGHLRITTETDEMFAASLPWRQRADMFKKLFPQFQDLLVAVIDAKEPEEAETSAASLAKALASDREHFLSVRRPDSSPFLEQEGLLYP